MVKVLLLVIIISGVAFWAYNQGIKDALTQTSELSNAEKNSNSAVTADAPVTDTTSNDSNQTVSSGRVLDLSGKELAQTPKYVFEQIDIEELNLSNNTLTGSLQAEIRHLQNLKVLNLSNNQFTGVPAEIGQLKNLEVLDLSNNRITGLPLELGNLTSLKIINLKGNAYSEFDLQLIKERLPASVMIETN